MNIRSTRIRLVAGVFSALAVGALGLSASPASAAKDDGFVRGYDTYKGDWGDEGPMAFGFGKHNKSNAVCLWQKILWAEGATESDGTPFDKGDVDGEFGPNTDTATRSLQAKWKLTMDGEVGGDTFGRADDELKVTSGSDKPGKQLNMTYYGDKGSFSVVRNSEGKYSFRDGDDTWRIAAYGYRTCS
ncbi:peptidoglycan-binding protein [Kribbella sp. NPDC056951]|uniref:peptidoglycan-binding domain-containing protein n=1 Tax=Kribbella sp. NPDC056951 TaxID=3345978 RepID=UPI00362BA2B8